MKMLYLKNEKSGILKRQRHFIYHINRDENFYSRVPTLPLAFPESAVRARSLLSIARFAKAKQV